MGKKPVRALLVASMLETRPASQGAEVIASVSPVDAPLAQASAPAPRIVQTVKLQESDLVRLKTLSVRSRRKQQDILLTALREYLDRQGA